MPTPTEAAAEWMVSEARAKGELYQEDAVYEVQRRFGEICVRENDAGNLAFSPALLKAFRKVSGDLIWDAGNRLWRPREHGDEPGRRQT